MDLSHCTVLAVDDTRLNLDVLVNTLGANHELAVSLDGETALEMALESPPDLILLDIMMPRISGIEVCNRVKSAPETRDILVLIVSARDSQADRIDGLTHGADDYVSKPFHLRSLVRKIEHMLTKRREDAFEQEIYGRPQE